MIELPRFTDQDDVIKEAQLAHRMKRFLAYVIDLFPIMMLMIFLYQSYWDTEGVIDQWVLDPDDPDHQAAFVRVSGQINLAALVFYIFYSIAMEASNFQATWGKRLMGLKVVTTNGDTISLKEAFWRNAFKIISQLIWNMGFFWILFDRQKRGWHDIIAKTLVVDANYSPEIEEVAAPSPTLTPSIPEDKPKEKIESYLSIYDGNQSNLLYKPEISRDELSKINSLADTLSEGEHVLWQYAIPLNDELLEEYMDLPEDLFWNNRTRGQKALTAFIIFDSMVKKFGVRRLFSAAPEKIFAIGEALQLFGLTDLVAGYHFLIKETNAITPILKYAPQFQKALNTWDARNIPEPEGPFDDIQTKDFDTIYRAADYQSACYDKVCHYIESNIGEFVQ